MKVLITGVGGYLGSVLAKKILEETDYEIVGLDNFLYGRDPVRSIEKNERVKIVEGDLRDIQLVTETVQDVEVIIHLASIVGDQACTVNPFITKVINVESTRLLAEQGKRAGVKQFIFASTCSVYGASPNKWLTEESLVKPISLYGETKVECEELLKLLSDDNFSVTIFRMATLFGVSPRMRFDLAVNVMTANAFNNRLLKVFGGSQWRPFLHVSDAAEAYVLAIGNPGGVFNVGSTNFNYTINHVAKAIKNEFPDCEVEVIDQGDKRDYKVNCSKVRNAFGFVPLHNVITGIGEISSWLEENKVDTTSSVYSNFKYLSSSKELMRKVYTEGPI